MTEEESQPSPPEKGLNMNVIAIGCTIKNAFGGTAIPETESIPKNHNAL